MRDLYVTAAMNALYSLPCFALFYPLAWIRTPNLMLVYDLLTGPFIAIPFAVLALGMNLIGATGGLLARLFSIPAEPVAALIALWLAFKFGSGNPSGLGDKDMLTIVSMLAVGTPWIWRSGFFGMAARIN